MLAFFPQAEAAPSLARKLLEIHQVFLRRFHTIKRKICLRNLHTRFNQRFLKNDTLQKRGVRKMTELEEAILGKKTDDEETEAEQAEEQPAAPEEIIQESMEAVRRMTEEIEQENAALEQRFAQVKPEEKPVRKRRFFRIGTFSSIASLIFMGIAMTVSLFSPIGILGAFRLAPIMLIFLGIEIAFSVFVNKSTRLRFDPKSLILTVSLIAVTFLMSIISVTNSVTGGERHYAQERLQNMLAREIRRAIPSDNVRNVNIEILLYGEDPEAYETIRDLTDSDTINLSVEYNDAQMSTYEFAGYCRGIVQVLSDMPYNFGEVSFIADDEENRYSLDLNWLYQSDLGTNELVPFVNYFGEDIVHDIPDLIDE